MRILPFAALLAAAAACAPYPRGGSPADRTPVLHADSSYHVVVRNHSRCALEVALMRVQTPFGNGPEQRVGWVAPYSRAAFDVTPSAPGRLVSRSAEPRLGACAEHWSDLTGSSGRLPVRYQVASHGPARG